MAPPAPRTRRNALRSHLEAWHLLLSYPQVPLAPPCFLLFAFSEVSEVGDGPSVPNRLTQVVSLKNPPVDSTGRCNTVGFGCCLDRRCASGKAGSSRRVVRGEQEGAVGEVEGRGVHKRHRPGIT